MRVHFIIHEDFEAPGAYEAWATQRGDEISYSRVYTGETLPESVEQIDLLVIMGGPQSPDTTRQQCPHFDAKGEKAVIAAAISAGKAVIGVCLGAQLTGEALNAKYDHSPEKEIGKFPISMTAAGREHPLFSHFGQTLAVGHWHNDMPGLTADVQIMAFSEGCPRQIVAYSDRVFGFQCHMELTSELVELLIAHAECDLNRAAEFRFVDTADVIRSHDYRQMNEKLFIFLDKLADYYASHQ